MDVAPIEPTTEPQGEARPADPAVAATAAAARPLCVDLDGTLIAGDLLWESVARLARQRPAHMLMTPVWLAAGKAHLKHSLAGRVRIDPAALPYRQEVLDFLRTEKALGRRIVLVTASHVTLANAVAEHLGLFDEVMGSDAGRNLKGETKLAALRERFPGGFDYVGDSPADLCLWRAVAAGGGRAFVVAPSRSLAARARQACDPHCEPRKLCPRPGLRLKDVKLLRPHQWVKNVLLFLPLLLAHRVTDLHRWVDVLVAFLAFSLTASSVYVINDLLDVEADRHHPTKRNRPFASGRLPLTSGPPLVLGLLATAAVLCWGMHADVGPRFAAFLGFYLLVSTAYSLWLKAKMLVDIMVLAGLYTLRILAGGAAAGVPVSKWMAAFSIFLFVSLAFAKRYTELLHLERKGEEKAKGRNYEVQDLRIIEGIGPANGYLAVLVLAMYISDASVTRLYPAPEFLWLLCPLLMFWVTRVWFFARRRWLHDDPIIFAIKDRISWYCLFTAGVLVVLASLHWPFGSVFGPPATPPASGPPAASTPG